MTADVFPTPLDWAALAALLVSLLAGVARGFLYEAIALCGWVGGFFLARDFASDTAAWLPLDGYLPGVQLAAGFALVYVVAVFTGGFTAWLVSRGAESVGLRAVDRGLGAVFGVCRAMAFVVLMVWLCSATSLVRKPWWPHSLSLQLASGFMPLLPKKPPSPPKPEEMAALLQDPQGALQGAAPKDEKSAQPAPEAGPLASPASPAAFPAASPATSRFAPLPSGSLMENRPAENAGFEPGAGR